MCVGTKSTLFGVHCLLIHPWFVARAWCELYGVPLDPRLWFAFVLHDVGYLGQASMEGPGAEAHVALGARVIGWLFGPDWAAFCRRHSRTYARSRGLTVSRLCVADKLAFVITPGWLYLPLARATGELSEYMEQSRVREQGSGGFTRTEWSMISSSDATQWLRGLQAFTRRWVSENRESAESVGVTSENACTGTRRELAQ